MISEDFVLFLAQKQKCHKDWCTDRQEYKGVLKANKAKGTN